jgi:hypothetical protein
VFRRLVKNADVVVGHGCVQGLAITGTLRCEKNVQEYNFKVPRLFHYFLCSSHRTQKRRLFRAN